MAATAAATRAPAAAGGFTAVELEMFAGVLLRAVRYGQALPVRLCGLNRVPPAASPRLAAGPEQSPRGLRAPAARLRAEDEMVEIVPQFSFSEIRCIGGTYGPFQVVHALRCPARAAGRPGWPRRVCAPGMRLPSRACHATPR